MLVAYLKNSTYLVFAFKMFILKRKKFFLYTKSYHIYKKKKNLYVYKKKKNLYVITY